MIIPATPYGGTPVVSPSPSVRYNPMAKPPAYGYANPGSSVAAAIAQQQQQQLQQGILD